ncbi:MAG TPA: TolC family protein [Phenylobacterium sp.]|nr:TolC family protein [Phenylobacterium sp.]HQN49622.1 TolC family protein [Phenylobacterium sp.]
MKRLVSLLALLTLAPAANAAEQGLPRPDFLPADTQIMTALEASPSVAEARAMLGAAGAEARVLAAGDHELYMATSLDQRRIRGAGDYSEWSVQLSRGLRTPGKRLMDVKAGEAGVGAARDGVEDAVHQASLQLADLWVAWLEAEARANLDRAEVATYARDVAGLKRRVALKDAAPLDLQQADAALARAQAQAAETEGLAAARRAELDAGFPGLAPPNPPGLSAPQAPLRPFEAWRTLIPERSHEIHIARLLADRQGYLARRARLDRLPDPTLGLRTFNERGGEETGFGLTLSVPLGVARRSATADRQTAEAAAAEARWARMVREVGRTAETDVIAARSGLAAWKEAAAAAQATEVAGGRIQRAYELGERDLADLLVARRQIFEAQRQELAARARANAALLKLALDAHELWLQEDHE